MLFTALGGKALHENQSIWTFTFVTLYGSQIKQTINTETPQFSFIAQTGKYKIAKRKHNRTEGQRRCDYVRLTHTAAVIYSFNIISDSWHVTLYDCQPKQCFFS